MSVGAECAAELRAVEALTARSSEAAHQRVVVRVLRRLKLAFHAPSNGEVACAHYRGRDNAYRLSNAAHLGLERGAPDLMVHERRGPYTGLALELKKPHTGRLSDAQKAYMHRLGCRSGYVCVTAYGAREALDALWLYLALPDSLPCASESTQSE